jgi:pimeloyl-ACP methyl ester carboxylesterase
VTARLLQLPSGGAVGITVLGDPGAAHTVLLCHPTPGASGFDPDPLVSAARSTRIVSADRPGYGASTVPAATVPVPHLAELALFDSLSDAGTRIDAVVGWGFGGLLALRLAAERADRVRRVVLVQTPAPRSRLYGVTGRRARAWALQHDDPELAHDALVGGTRIGSLSLLGAHADDEALALPGLRERCERMLDEAVRQQDAGLRFDRRAARRHDWGDVARGIRARVLVVYGARDPRLGQGDASWFARHLARVDVRIVKEAGPLAIASEWSDVLDFALGG